jgi:hypothetical protein
MAQFQPCSDYCISEIHIVSFDTSLQNIAFCRTNSASNLILLSRNILTCRKISSIKQLISKEIVVHRLLYLLRFWTNQAVVWLC